MSGTPLDRLSHYSHSDGLSLGRLVPYVQDDEPRPKPRGFWVSVDGEYDWPWWCREEQFELVALRYHYRVRLTSDANVLILDTESKMLDFHEQYGEDLFAGGHVGRYQLVGWKRVAEDYAGIVIAPYFWCFRFDTELSNWYYGWDCASGCIWEHNAIESIEMIPQADFTN